MKIAIITRPDNRSPKVLANSLKIQLEEAGVSVKIFYEIVALKRLVTFRDSKLSFQFWLRKRLWYFFSDLKLKHKLSGFDAVIISEIIPNAFLRSQLNIERLKKIIQKPVGLFAVYYLGNAPTQFQFLKNENECTSGRFDFHLSVSATTEVKQPVSDHYFAIGLKGKSFQLRPLPKKELVAIVDFLHPGNQSFRKSQIECLKKAGIKYVSLENSYTVDEIRKIYQQGSFYFMQSSESFGLPILECLCSGCQIFTPESWWPMSWRLNENPKIHGEGILPECFTVYNGEEDLINKLLEFKRSYDLDETPKKVFDNFLKYYRDFYFGNEFEIDRFLKRFQNFA